MAVFEVTIGCALPLYVMCNDDVEAVRRVRTQGSYPDRAAARVRRLSAKETALYKRLVEACRDAACKVDDESGEVESESSSVDEPDSGSRGWS